MLTPDELIYSNPNSEPQGGKENNLIPFIDYHTPAPERCLNMLLKKYHGERYQSEVIMVSPERTAIPVLKKELSEAVVMLVTDGGLVPVHNPDQIPSTNAGVFGVYDIKGKDSLDGSDYEVSHQGYDNSYVEEDPDRLVPVDMMRQLEKEHIIGRLYDAFISTTGVMTSVEGSQKLGKQIADYIQEKGIDAVIITSACGTSTRCGAYIAMAIEKLGIPVVQITNLTKIAKDVGCSRVLQGKNVCYPLGEPKIGETGERIYRRELLLKGVEMLRERPVREIRKREG